MVPVGSAVKNPPASAGDTGLIPNPGRSPKEGKATHSSILAFEILWTQGPGHRGIYPQDCKESDAT